MCIISLSERTVSPNVSISCLTHLVPAKSKNSYAKLNNTRGNKQLK